MGLIKFDELTDHQRQVLFELIDQTKGRGQDKFGVHVFDDDYGGPLFLRIVEYDRTSRPVIPRKYRSHSPDMTLIQHARANSFEIFTTMENLHVLKTQGYLELTPKQTIEDPPGKLWQLLLCQKAFDHYDLMHQRTVVRFWHWLWPKIKNLLSFLKDIKGLAG